jgi:predicted nucleotidyltransferase
MNKPEDLVALAAAVLESCNVKFALIGGCARNVYAPPRATRDVDLSVALDATQLQAVEQAFAHHQFVPATTVSADPADAVPDLILFQSPTSERIDLLIVKTEFEESALQRAQRTPAYGLPQLPVVTAEDLIVFKLLASRPRDLADTEEVARSQERAGRALDWLYIEKHCTDWGVDAQLAALRKRLGF